MADALRQIKQAFDPLCLLNCDKVIRVEDPTTSRLQHSDEQLCVG